MIERTLKAGAPCSWVAADEVYGNNSKLRQWLEARRLGDVLAVAVASDQRLRWPDCEQRRVDAIAQNFAGTGLGAGFRWLGQQRGTALRLDSDPGLERGWLEPWITGVAQYRRKPEHAYNRFYAPTQKATLKTLVRVAEQRWQIE